MGYKLTNDAHLARQVERARGVLLQQLDADRTYTVEEILEVLRGVGLDYSNPEYREIAIKLIQQGVIEEVP